MLFTFSVSDAGSAEPSPRAPLDALWQEQMLIGGAATIYVDDSGQRTVSIPRTPFDEQRGVVSSVESAAATTRGIEVSRLDERFLLWRNGGWILQGGLLGLVREQVLGHRAVWEGGDPASRVCAWRTISTRPAYDDRIRVLSAASEGQRPTCDGLASVDFQPGDVVKDSSVRAMVRQQRCDTDSDCDDHGTEDASRGNSRVPSLT
jgi:hypothetical protein